MAIPIFPQWAWTEFPDICEYWTREFTDQIFREIYDHGNGD